VATPSPSWHFSMVWCGVVWCVFEPFGIAGLKGCALIFSK